jgi:phospholipid/cholesterol/gamma-HCH transport system ATP-binding protein
VIELHDVGKKWQGEWVLRDVSLEIPEGQYVGLIGPGGSGKTLLIKLMAGLVAPDAGAVIVDGQRLEELDAQAMEELRFRMGMLFQNFALFDFMTVAENLAFPLRQAGETDAEAIAERVDAALGDIGLRHASENYPIELSGGMKKRVSFARAVIRRPPLLFYDDPTAGLDPVTSAKIFELLTSIRDAGGTTSVTAGHDLRGIRRLCERVVMLDEGRIVLEGSIEAFDACRRDRVAAFWQSSRPEESA